MMGAPGKTVFVAALDWGLGHAARTLPVIRELIRNNCRVLIGVSGMQEVFYRSEIGDAEYFPLTGYNVRYSSSLPLTAGLLFSWPRFRKVMENEHQALKEICKTRRVDLIISDNRYGLWHHDIPSVCITHQRKPAVPAILSPFRRLVYGKVSRLLKPFQTIWVPDDPALTLSGSLSGMEGDGFAVPVGLLSRFDAAEKTEQDTRYDLAILLSGPEPHRSRFEKRILAELSGTVLTFVLFRGLPGNSEVIAAGNGTVQAHADTSDIRKALLASRAVLCRAGYSSLCDLIRLNKKAIVVPTPGQSEQEYLARHTASRNWFHAVREDKLSILHDLECALSLPGPPSELPAGRLLEENLRSILKNIG